MNCRELIDFIMRYLDGELPAEEHDEFERHMKLCSQCVDYIENYKKSVDLGKAACNEGDCDDIPEELVQAILKARKKA